MASTNIGVVEMNIGSGRTIALIVPLKIIEYFEIIQSVVPVEAYLRKREGHTRTRRNRQILSDARLTSVAVETAEWWDTRTQNKGGIIGKLIRIPTQLRSKPDVPTSNIRLVSMRVPAAATNYVVAQWINTRFVAKKPTYYITQSGVTYPVNVPTQADPNPGNDTTPDPTP